LDLKRPFHTIGAKRSFRQISDTVNCHEALAIILPVPDRQTLETETSGALADPAAADLVFMPIVSGACLLIGTVKGLGAD
jgi:hypothetical protein